MRLRIRADNNHSSAAAVIFLLRKVGHGLEPISRLTLPRLVAYISAAPIGLSHRPTHSAASYLFRDMVWPRSSSSLAHLSSTISWAVRSNRCAHIPELLGSLQHPRCVGHWCGRVLDHRTPARAIQGHGQTHPTRPRRPLTPKFSTIHGSSFLYPPHTTHRLVV